MIKKIIYTLKNRFITKFIASNNYILVALILSPLLIYTAFGTSFHSSFDDNSPSLGFNIPSESESKFYHYQNGTPLSKNELKENTNPTGLKKNITKKEEHQFKKYLINSLITASEISFLIGSVFSALIWGYMTNEGSIVYQILSKKSREKAFFELFSYPLFFVIFISIIVSFVISSQVFLLYTGMSISFMFKNAFIIISSSMFFGYVFSGFLSLTFKNSFLPIFSSFLIIGSIFVFSDIRNIIIPFESVIVKSIAGLPIDNLSIVGMGLMGLCVVGSYAVFKRRSYY